MRSFILATLLAMTGCASKPDPTALCGVWAHEDMREQWWLDGEGLRGEGRLASADTELVTETLALRRTRDGYVYVAKPGDAEPTEFEPIDPRTARFGPDPAELDPAALRLSWANYEHDFPQEIHYLIVGDRLTALIGGPGRETAWEFTRASACSNPR